MILESPWKVTFDSIELIAFADYMAGEPRFAHSQTGETVEIIRAEFAVQDQPSPNITNSISFTLLREYADGIAAANALLALLAAMPTGVHDATIETDGGDTYTLAGARIESADPEIMDGNLVKVGYTLIGGELSLVP